MTAPPQERVAILVTHLLGSGHLARAAALAAAVTEAGHAARVISGGMPVAVFTDRLVDLVQLPPVQVRGTDFADLRDAAGNPIDAAYRAERRDRIVAFLNEFEPTVLITELFPFGRRSLKAEFEAALAAARALRPRPAVLASIRDVLAPPGSPAKAIYAAEMLGRHYDAVLVHGDFAALPLSQSWPVDDALARHLHDTGYLEDARPGPSVQPGPRDPLRIVVSGGGSAAGLPLFFAAIAAAPHLPEGASLHLLVGQAVHAEAFAALCEAAAGKRILVERVRPDFRALLAGAGVSVSRAGYNTVLDVAATGVAPVLVPFAEGGEREQTIRATALAEAGFAETVPERELSGARLAQAIRAAIGRRPDTFAARRDGKARSAVLVARFAGAARNWNAALRRLDAALDRAAAAGAPLRFWWRDDDAVAPTPALDRLLALRTRYGMPLALAVIPAAVEPALAGRLAGEPRVDVILHGSDHRNRAAPGAKKQELFAVPEGAARARLAAGRDRLADLFGTRFLPVLAPPWNRIDPALIADLPGLGLIGLSTFGQRYEAAAAGLLPLVDTHIDPIDWGGGGRHDPGDSLAETARWAEESLRRPVPAIGILSHHLRHDAWVWGALEDLFAVLATRSGAGWVGLGDVLGRTDKAIPAAAGWSKCVDTIENSRESCDNGRQ
jgi:predicted glycosyltransferase